ncbi:MAG: DNA polymerase IV, partial [Acutalibacteraceae bacterium]
MKSDRIILHSDLNCFYASVEIMLNPALRGKPVAVCGNTQDRHGIVLAKSQPAKLAGVKTAMTNWQAKRLCPELIFIEPHF